MDADAVTFAVEIEVLGPPSVIAQSALAPVVGPVPTLADDLAALFREVPTAPGASVVINNFSDITVVFTTPANAVKKFRAHRALLAARSPVFRRKLLSKSVNAKLFFNGNHYYLQEADVGVCEAFMVFLYTDDVSPSGLVGRHHPPPFDLLPRIPPSPHCGRSATTCSPTPRTRCSRSLRVFRWSAWCRSPRTTWASR